jgi:hypothetical protein
MKRVSKDASLAEKTVQTAAELAQAKHRKERALEGRPRSSKVQIVQVVDPRVWSEALALAGGDARRISVISETEVRVMNSRR